MRILVTDGMDKAAMAKLTELGHEVVAHFYEPDELGKALRDFDVVVVRSKTKVRANHVDEAKGSKLKLVIRGGVGVDNIDVKYAEENGIKVTNTPKASSESVAELALAHMFSLARFVGISNHTMRNGEWNKKQYEGIELNGKTLGLIGMGRISQALAKRACALGMKVIYTDIIGEIPGLSYAFMTRDEVMKNADFVSLHIPASPDGKPVIGANELALMKPTAFIINTARGGLICEDALCDALDAGKLAGAALDVFASEPLKNERIMKNDKISLTPHIGGSTVEAQGRIGMEIVDIITKFFEK
ncbi:MAG: D-2-hydroxyacid dehydrogenase [Clostridiaceae bacterium]|nr:D-2-hydroxyacid dehydrogenase [Clostridiaceae bacterium]